ncbi:MULTISPECIES: branched-chain amino acid transport system II carrier protein [unclassified Anaerobiospirillum]|uniref:branched-chain amino acid transport system II carrier protein n=1 Tax=unclassified Anaerobiospirillum TaxID=2647410 RepID=UPI001FF6B09C|nr:MULTISPECIES: branched-chain amino acid transport system II carrier protein [unclassified Anaerobiospirillum]MCK0535850.1 branched-chain amino acid transport system II carrier protein [Anaerobiospirillum sp. NML120511]MCK0541056.1 branched-chain amino acid transport system II carrier protein [Anaerobiospirillum sp. NML02-A-032]
MSKLTIKEIILLGMTNFALYVGAGNIIFPPILGLQSGTNVTPAAIGFLITGVGLPVIAAVAMARLGGSMEELTKPIGAKAGFIATAVCFLCIGPLFAIPRTATVAYELAIKPFVSADTNLLPGYSVFYFIIATIFAMYPAKILDTVGKVLSPIKIAALIILCITAIFLAPSEPAAPQEQFVDGAFALGIVNGYLTLDTLASLAFAIIIVNAIRSHGVTDAKPVTRYAIMSGCMAGVGFIFIYICLFRLGNTSVILTPEATNGAEVLSAYVSHAFGNFGNIFLAVLIIVACMVTAIGLICACSSYFETIWPIRYRTYAVIFAVVSCAIANFGLTTLINISVPGLISVYPMFIVLVMTSFFRDFFINQRFVIAPVCALALLFGINDGIEAAGLNILPDSVKAMLPLYDSDLSWLLPSIILCVVLAVVDRMVNKKAA